MNLRVITQLACGLAVLTPMSLTGAHARPPAQGEDKADCAGRAPQFDELVGQLQRQCTDSAQCRAEILDWTGCGRPTAHSDAPGAAALVEARSESHRRCGYVRAPCASPPSTARCVHRRCETDADFWAAEHHLTVRFTRGGRPLAHRTIEVDFDNGTRCEAAPCPSRSVLGTYQTDKDGNLRIDLGLFFPGREAGPANDIPSRVPALVRPMATSASPLRDVRFRHGQEDFFSFDVDTYLASAARPFHLHVRWPAADSRGY